jgi:hypothetical protein
MTRKLRADSTASKIKAMSDAALGLLEPPSHVKITQAALPYWEGIVRARARDEWSEVDLVVVGQLAQCQCDIAEQDVLLRQEGSIVANDRGTQIMNPRATLMENLARREMALMRTLRLGGSVSGDKRDDAKRRSIQRQSEEIRKELEEDSLLA